MRKLFKLKQLVTVPEAAQHLSILLNEDVTEADVLQLGLDGHLTLSVSFASSAIGRRADRVPRAKARWCIRATHPDGSPASITGNACVCCREDELSEEIDRLSDDESVVVNRMWEILNETEVVDYTDNIIILNGIWDLPMIGSERAVVEYAYQESSGVLAVKERRLDTAFASSVNGELVNLLEDAESQRTALSTMERLNRQIADSEVDEEERETLRQQRKELLASFEDKLLIEEWGIYYPSKELPKDCMLVIRTEALQEFEQTLSHALTDIEKPITPTERHTLLTIIAALCKHAEIDPKARGTAIKIAEMTEQIGAPVSDDTIRRHLKDLPDAVESRMK